MSIMCVAVDAVEFEARLAEYSSAFYDHDVAATKLAHARALESVPCLVQVVSPGTAAALHRVHGMQQWFDAPQLVVSTFTASRLADPTSAIPVNAALPNDHVRGLWEIGAERGSLQEIETPPNGQMWVDGRRGDERFALLPALVQVVDATGTLRYSRYLEAGEQPDYGMLGRLPAPTSVPLGTWAQEHFRGATVPLGVTAIGLGITSLGLYGYAAARRADFEDRSVQRDETELRRIAGQTNVAETGSQLAAVTSACLATGAVLSVRW